jgi:excisionase family DNA binding protein
MSQTGRFVARTTGRESLGTTPTLETNMKELAKLTFSVPETATLLGISRAHAYELVARKELPAIRLGRRVLVPRRAIQELLQHGD